MPRPLAYDELTLTTPMLPSINAKFGHRHYITTDYRRRENEAVADLMTQLHAINVKRFNAGSPLWQPRESDRYIVTYFFEFRHDLQEDLDNPLKPTCDALQKAEVIWNDNRNIQKILDKTTHTPYPYAHIIVRKFHKDVFTKVPLDELVTEWLLAQQYSVYRFGG